MQRVVEGLTNVFWLAAWATFASYATALNLVNARLVQRRGPHESESDSQRDPDALLDGLLSGPAHTSSTDIGPATAITASSANTGMAAKISIAVDSAIGAAIWVLL